MTKLDHVKNWIMKKHIEQLNSFVRDVELLGH